jgi:hypothetical protein
MKSQGARENYIMKSFIIFTLYLIWYVYVLMCDCSGKARKGDGNDLTPNPRKLCSIGKELDKLGRIINDMTPVSELPFNIRPKTRKEKNKLASRSVMLKCSKIMF